MEVAYQRPEIDRSSETLKLFVAPEFYWRGPRGAYDVDLLFEKFRTLTVGYSDHKFKDWTFIFGTAVGYDDVGDEF